MLEMEHFNCKFLRTALCKLQTHKWKRNSLPDRHRFMHYESGFLNKPTLSADNWQFFAAGKYFSNCKRMPAVHTTLRISFYVVFICELLDTRLDIVIPNPFPKPKRDTCTTSNYQILIGTLWGSHEDLLRLVGVSKDFSIEKKFSMD